MKLSFTVVLLFFLVQNGFADLKYYPVQFKITTDKAFYYEGEKITFLVTITNTDKENTYPVLLPHTQNTGQKLLYLNLYDKAENTLLLRATEDQTLKMMVHDTGTVKIRYLKPLEEIVIPVYLNDFENYYSYHTQNSSHHSFGAPLFAGKYKVNITYNPYGIPLGDSIYTYYFFNHPVSGPKLAMEEIGYSTNMVDLIIKRSADSLVSIEGRDYFIKTDGYLFYYYSEYVKEIISDLRLVHATNLPTDSFALANEYYYSHFTNLYGEYISRFEDGDLREYRKFRDECPDYLYKETFDAFKHKVFYGLQLPDKRFYSITYNQPSNKPHQETYCSEDGTLCMVTTYYYKKNGALLKKKTTQTRICHDIVLESQ